LLPEGLAGLLEAEADFVEESFDLRLLSAEQHRSSADNNPLDCNRIKTAFMNNGH